MTRRQLHDQTVSRIATRLRRNGIAASVEVQPRGNALRINGDVVRVHVATEKTMTRHWHGRSYDYPGYMWSRHIHNEPIAARGVEIFCAADNPAVVFVLPASVIGSRRTIAVMHRVVERKRRSRLFAYLNRFDLLAAPARRAA